MVSDALSWHPPITDIFCCTPHPIAPPTSTLDTFLVKENFLMHFLTAYFDDTDSEMRKFAQLDRSVNP